MEISIRSIDIKAQFQRFYLTEFLQLFYGVITQLAI